MIELPKDKVIITVAVTGAITRKAQNPNLPEQPEEIAADAYDCYNAGAAICHIHARDKEGSSTGSKEVFQAIRDKIRDRCNAVLNYSTGGGPNLTQEQRIECLQAQPEIASLNMGTLVRVSGPLAGTPFSNSRKEIQDWAQIMKDMGIKPELEVYNQAMFKEVELLIEKDLLIKPYLINMVMGMIYQGAVPATPKYLNSMLEFIPKDAIVNVCAVGAAQLPITTIGMLMGTCIRVGMEDNIYYRKGEPAISNAQLVERAVRIARELGKEPCTPEEAREILNIKPAS